MTSNDTLVTPVAPIETMNKTDLYKHIQEKHQHSYQITSKSSKDDMLRHHEAQHARTDYTQAVQRLEDYTDEQGRPGQRWVTNTNTPVDGRKEFVSHSQKVHEHVVVPTSSTQDERDLLNKIQGGTLEKPLSRTECLALEKIVNNDFAALKTEMRQYAEEILTQRIEAVREEYKDKAKDAEKHRKAAIKVLLDQSAKVLKVIEDAKAAGITLAGITAQSLSEAGYEASVKAAVAGQTDAESKVRAENNSDLNNALHTLERQRLSAQRLILIAGVSVEGQKLLDTIPSAKTLMVEAAASRTENKALTQ